MKPVYMFQICRLITRFAKYTCISDIFVLLQVVYIRSEQDSELTNLTARRESRKENEENKMKGCTIIHSPYVFIGSAR